MSLKQKLENKIFNAGLVSYQDLQMLIILERHKPATGDRRLRELVEDGKIKPVRNDKGWITGYRKVESGFIEEMAKLSAEYHAKIDNKITQTTLL